MKKYFLCMFVVLLSLSCRQQGSEVHLKRIGIETAMAQAQFENKAIFVFYYENEDDPYVKVFNEQIFKDKEIASFFNNHFVNVSLDEKNRKHWPDVTTKYGVYQSPTLLLLTPQAEVIAEISELGPLGYDAQGDLPCRPQMLRIAKIADAFCQAQDSSFFTPEQWKQLNQMYMRLDSKLFESVVDQKDYLRSQYGSEWDMMVDYTMAAASLRLMIYEKNKPARTNDYRVNTYYQVLEEYELPHNARYRLYADVNIAYGMSDLIKARQIAYQAYKDGVITEMEYLQLCDKL